MISFLVGVLIALVPNMICARIFFKHNDSAPKAIVRVLYGVELLKFLLTLVLFAGVFRYCTFRSLPLFLGFILGLFGAWITIILLTNPAQGSVKSFLL